MKFTKVLLLSAFIVFFVFSLVGAIMLSNIFHELNHYNDYKTIANVTQVCILAYPNASRPMLDNAGAFVITQYTPNQSAAVAAMSKPSEDKSTTITIIVYVIYLIALIITLWCVLDKLFKK